MLLPELSSFKQEWYKMNLFKPSSFQSFLNLSLNIMLDMSQFRQLLASLKSWLPGFDSRPITCNLW